jgi:hypothetical protein
MAKGSFIFYDVDLQSIDFLTDVQIGKLFRALKKYRLDGTNPDFESDTALNIIFHQITEHIAINEEKYKATCEKKSEAMKKRWSSENKNVIVDNRTLYNTIEKGLALGDTDTDTLTDTDTDTVTETDTVTDTDACGAKRENKRNNYYGKNYKYNNSQYKGHLPKLLRDEPSYDIDLFTQKAIGLKYHKSDGTEEKEGVT